MKSPCMECPNIGADIYCHTTCEKYKKFRKDIDASHNRRREYAAKRKTTQAHETARRRSDKKK